MTIKTTEKFETITFVGDDGKEETISLLSQEEAKKYVPAEAPKQQLHGCTIDARHPYIVFIVGVPVFAASTKLPDRVKAMVHQGIPAKAFVVLDTRDNKTYGVGV